MEAANKNIKQGRQSSRFAAWVAVLLVLPHFGGATWAQNASVTPDVESMQISHSLTEDIQPFPVTRWDISNSAFQNGCVVQWSLAAFTHEANSKNVADADLSLKMVRSGRSARWQTTAEYDSTNVSKRKNFAVVAAASSRRGDGVAELLIRFRTPHLSQLASGKYHSTLTGTISGL